MLKSQWHMYRMGLVDFWYYVNEEFMFEDGHMLLRGSNGSGKSVTMQSFIPLLLDGNKSSERLDSFGTRSRKLENYLLEEDNERNDRIGYLYLEFKREDSDVYKTIGMGLHARRNKPLDSWYFVIEDNRRIGREVFLMEDQLAISKQVLKNKIGAQQVIDGQKEYMERVNKALFNFSSLEEYRECINLLMQLRSPKLSNSLKPTMINEILSNSLQPLSEEDLRPMSEAISNMDAVKDQLDALKLSYSSARNIANVYEQYNYASLDKKASNYLKEEQIQKTIEKEIKKIEALNEQEQNELLSAKRQQKEKKLEQELLKDELANLVQKDFMQLVEEIEQCKQDKKANEIDLSAKKNQEEEKENQYIDAKNQMHKYQNQIDSKKHEIQQLFEEMTDCNETMQFEEHYAMENEMYSRIEQEYDFTYSKQKIDNELSALNQGLALYNEIHNEQILLKRILSEKEEQMIVIENANKERSMCEQQFYDLQEQYQEQFSKWNKNNQMLCFENREMLFIYDQLRTFIEKDTYETIHQMIQEKYQNELSRLNKEEAKQHHAHQEKKKELLSKKEELLVWENKKDPTPVLDPFEEASLAYLEEQGINSRPLYTLLEFSDEISKEKRNIFEEQLTRMGLLNALVVNQHAKPAVFDMPNGMANQFIFVNTQVEDLDIYELSLSKDGNVNLVAMLEYLGVEEPQLLLWEHTYHNGIITGTVSRECESVFIGVKARETYRLTKIANLQSEVSVLENETKELEGKIDELHHQLECLEKELHSYPSKEALVTAKNNIFTCDQNLVLLNQHLKTILNQLSVIEDKIVRTNFQISEIATHLGISVVFEVFQKRREAFMQYGKLLDLLSSNHHEYLMLNEMFVTINNRKEDLQTDLDTIRYERRTKEEKIEKLRKLIVQKEEKLNESGYMDVKKRIEEIQLRQRILPEEISRLDRLIGKLTQSIVEGEENLLEKQSILAQETSKKEEEYHIYLLEAQLGYVLKDENVYKDASYVSSYIRNKMTTLKGKDTLGNDLQTTFYNQRGALQEYGLIIQTLFDNQNEGNSRLDISARYKGERISFTSLLENLGNDIERQKMLLEDSDRILIEDILINTISKKIRNSIQNSRRWVETMNRYMNSMNTSSGLKLSLQWKSHKPETEEELSSDKLVSLLEMEPKILKESDFKSLSSHFQSKIQTARKLAEQEENHDSFHQIMKNVMDYRTWFDFKILYEKTGEKKKELTNNAFYAFSGGEKAMSMYVPLFSAVAAKFEGASEDAPLLIALDEAFAGVDEKNINNMFALIGKFGFDYIMNSQVLWGDYPSVRKLAIHELFRPENARYVTVISYVWNGSEKVMVNN